MGITALALLQPLSGDGLLVWGSGGAQKATEEQVSICDLAAGVRWPSMLGLTSSNWIAWGSEGAGALGPSLSKAPGLLTSLASESLAMVQTRIWIPVGEAVQLLVTGSGGWTGSTGPRLVWSESGGSTCHSGEEGWEDAASSSGTGEPCEGISS